MAYGYDLDYDYGGFTAPTYTNLEDYRVPGSLNADGTIYNPLADFDTATNQEPLGRDTEPVTSQDRVYDTAAKINDLERAGYTFVRTNPYGVPGGAGDLYAWGDQELFDLLAWLDTQDWTDPSSWEGRQAPDGTVVVPPPEVAQPTTQPTPTTQDDGNIFTDILGNIDFGGLYDFNIPDIFRNSTLDPTPPFVPQPTTTPTTASNGSSGANDGSTGGDTGVDLGNEDVPASDVVAGGQDSTLDGNNPQFNLLYLLGGLGAGQLAAQQQAQQAQQQASNTRTTDALFRDRLKFKTPNPGLLTPLYRS
jgi:hypothetical protein